jgi:hypothetical protein
MPANGLGVEDAAGHAARRVLEFLQSEYGAAYRDSGWTYEKLKQHYMGELVANPDPGPSDLQGDSIRSLLNGGDNAR